MRKYTGWIVAPLLVAATCVLVAQERRDPAADRQPAPGRGAEPARREPGAAPRDTARPAAGQVSRADQEIAAVKLACCRNELELAKLAQEKAQSEDVKQFAEKTIQENTEACAKLEQWAGPLAAARGERGERREPGAAGERREPARPGADVAVRVGQGGGLNWVSIHQQIADQSLASAKKEFAQKEGEEFDKCFIGMAIGANQATVDVDHVLMDHASQQFRGEIADCLKMATTNLHEAKNIMQKLEGKSPRVSRKPE